MIYEIVSVFDRAVNGFGRPFFTPSLGAATRSFTDEVNRVADDNQMHKHPDDFDLYHIGSFDDSNGSITGQIPTIVLLGKAAAIAAAVGR